MKNNYYAESLNSQKLYQVYQTKYERVKQYFNEEISFVRNQLRGNERVLELGAGYGRIIKELACDCNEITGIDISKDNVEFGNEYLKDLHNAKLVVMDVNNLQFNEKFDCILCLQNGLSAMRIDPSKFIKIILNLLKDQGKIFISTYSPKFWDYRLAWFQEQAEKNLLGEIDLNKTKDGKIVCKDGFFANTHSLEQLVEIGILSGYEYKVTEVDNSSIFLVITKK